MPSTGETWGGGAALATQVRLTPKCSWSIVRPASAARGLPDVEIVGNGERIDTLQEVCAVTTKPILIDGDTGGTAEQFAYFARALGRVGASGVIIEDKRVPKRNSLDENNATSYHETMGTVLASRGFDIIIIYGNHMLRAAHRAIARVAEAIPEHDRSPGAGELCTTVPELFALVGYNDVVSWRPGSAPRSPSQ